jgi:glycosyltransferase involved in cell wall biosynthesis
MKICLIAPVPPFRGAVSKYCYSLAQELEKRHDLLLLSYKRQYPEFLYGKKSQIDPDFNKSQIKNEFKRLSYDIDSADIVSWLETSKRIVAFKPDTVILPWWVAYWTPMYLYLLYSLEKKGITVVFLCINVFEHENNRLKQLLTKLILGRVDSIIVHSEGEKAEILKFNPAATIKKHLLPLFKYDTHAVIRHDKQLHLLFFGFVRSYKGLDILLNAIGLLKRHDITLKIVGEFWNDKNDYITLINKLNISDQVEIIDYYVPDDELSHFFSWADLVVLPYKNTRTSGIIATAYGFRKPVLATNVGGFYEVIEDKITGRLVPPGDPQSFADGILWFLNNRHLNFEENIAQFTSQYMSWGSLVTMIEEFDKRLH